MVRTTSSRYAVVMLRQPTSLLAFVAVLGAAACSSQSSSTTAPASSSTSSAPVPSEAAPIDTSQAVAFTEAEVQRLFDLRCVKCHDTGSANVDLSPPFTRDTVGVAVGGASGKTLCGRSSDVRVRIQPGDREASLLWHKVEGTQDCGSPMPFDRGNAPLDAMELARLGLYIDGLPR
jgi:uncharacterized lipoprotein